MNFSHQQRIHYVLRIAVAMCFIGHGSFGIITKEAWGNYFAVVGVSQHLSYQLMPVIGCFNILLGLIMLIYPVKAIPAWLAAWGFVTALLRPISGEPFAEFMERAGNFGVPLSLILLSGIPGNIKGWFIRMEPGKLVDAIILARVATCLKIVVCLLLFGHGWLNVIGKEALLSQYESLGFSNPDQVAQIIGTAEITAAFVVLMKPFRALLFALFIWKMGSELFHPHYLLFEWIERAGSYGAFLALWMVTEKHTILKFIPADNYTVQKSYLDKEE